MDETLRVDTSPLSQLDQRFLLILFASIATHVLIATWVAHQPAPPAEVELEQQPNDRFAPLLPIPKVFAPPTRIAQPTPSAPAPSPRAPRPEAPAPNLLGLVTSGLKELDGSDSDVHRILEGAQLGHVDTTDLAVRRDSARRVETVAPLVTDGAGQVGYGAPLPTRVGPMRGHIQDLIIDDPPPGLPDPTALQRFIHAHQSALAYCYEAELKHRRDLRGKLTVRFTLTALGRAADVATLNDSLGSPGLALCIRSTVQRWVFPFRPEDDFPVEFPVLFTPAQ